MNGHTDAAVPLLVGGADQTIKNKDGLILGGCVQAHINACIYVYVYVYI
jgi:hypothetical protein